MIFKDKYFFLSNFYPCKVRYNGNTYLNSEAAFQAAKCPEAAYRFFFLNGAQAKKLGKQLPLREDWEEIKLQIMEEIIRCKFTQNPELREALLNVEGEIIEDNFHHDTFWGQCDGIGENHLGKILMKIREELLKD